MQCMYASLLLFRSPSSDLHFSPWDINHQQFWLLGYEFPATLLVFTTEMVYVVTTAKKGKENFLTLNTELSSDHALHF